MIKEGIEALDMEAIKDKTLDFEDLPSWPALLLVWSYRALKNVLYKPAPLTQSSLPASNTLSTPPNQATIPANPKFSKESTGSSSSAASKAEHFTEKFAEAFIEASFESISRQLGEDIPWLDPKRRFRLIFPLLVIICLKDRSQHKMTIRLGMQTVTVIDDGGISLSSNRDFFVSHVLSLEVSHSLIKLILKAKRMKRSVPSWKLHTLMLLRYFVRCWDKFAMGFSTKILIRSIKRLTFLFSPVLT